MNVFQSTNLIYVSKFKYLETLSRGVVAHKTSINNIHLIKALVNVKYTKKS